MAAPNEALDHCLAEAVHASGPLLQRCLEKAVASLQAAQDRTTSTPQRDELSGAWRELQSLVSVWPARYQAALRLAFDSHHAQGAAPTPNPSTWQTLTLVDQADVEQQLEDVRLAAQLQSLVDEPLGGLDALVSSALGLAAVRREQNPLRPQVFVKGLRELISQAEGSPQRQSLWRRHMAPAMGAELGDLYRRLSPLLSNSGVAPVAYRIAHSASAPAPLAPTGPEAKRVGTAALDPTAPRTRPGGLPGDGSPSSIGGAARSGAAGVQAGSHDSVRAGLLADPRLRSSMLADLFQEGSGDELVREFLSRDDGQGQAALAPGYYARVAAALARLETDTPESSAPPDPHAEASYRQLPVVERPPRPVSTETPLNSSLWGQYGQAHQRSIHRTRLKTQAQKVDQVLGLELVRKLVNQVAADPRLLGPVRESIIALEPSLLRLALVEPRFFSDDRHPGRCLVERVAARSLRYNDEFSPEFKEFLRPVIGHFRALNADEASDARAFTAALAALESSWGAVDAQEECARAKALDALRFAERRQAAADQIAQALARRADMAAVPQAVQEFLYGPWSLVMAQARLSDASGQIDPGAHGSVITDLLWSVTADAIQRDQARLIQLIPGLLQRLRTGLSELGQTPQDCATLFQTLERLHCPVLETRARRRGEASAPVPLPTAQTANPPRPVPRQQPRPGDTPWMGRRELADAGFAVGPNAVLCEGPPSDWAEGPASHLQALDSRPGSLSARTPAGAGLTRAEGSGTAPAPLAAANGTMRTSSPLGPAEVAQLLAGLQEDRWVDLYSDERWRRARLAWASSRGTLFMFLSHGGHPHSMTRRVCERLLRERLLRPVEMHGIVAHAIGLVAQPGATNAAGSVRV